ncbi:discoidin domain-containing protein [Photobacterium sagamiensis]|uniref:discoidin domain-containing protein n=1 Tax=Photobacterium sagamiensis TaxID=2910241 RepID=UPI003D105963
MNSLKLKNVVKATSLALMVGALAACSGGNKIETPIEFAGGNFIDTFENLDLSYDSSMNLQFEEGDEYGRFDGDSDRVLRMYNEAEYITYEFTDGLKAVKVNSFFWRDPSEKNVGEFTIEVSQDGEVFTPLAISAHKGDKIVDKWQKVAYTATDIGAENKYLRIIFPLSVNDSNGWAPQLGSVEASSH